MHKDQVEEWNAILDKEYPNIKQYPIKDISSYGGKVAEYQEELQNIYTRKNNDKENDKEYFIPRMIRATEKKIKGIVSSDEDSTEL